MREVYESDYRACGDFNADVKACTPYIYTYRYMYLFIATKKQYTADQSFTRSNSHKIRLNIRNIDLLEYNSICQANA